jgi:hypothetical protein
MHAAAADVPVVTMTRVDTSIAGAIARAVGDTRTSTVVIGWDGRHGGTRAVFGRVLDHLLDETRAQALVARLSRPPQVARTVLVAVPSGLERHAGIGEVLRTVNTIAAGVGAPVRLLPVGGSDDVVRALQAQARPHVPASVQGVADAAALERALADAPPDDLVVLLAARRGTAAWSPELHALPARLAAAGGANLVVAYLPEEPPPAPS